MRLYITGTGLKSDMSNAPSTYLLSMEADGMADAEKFHLRQNHVL